MPIEGVCFLDNIQQPLKVPSVVPSEFGSVQEGNRSVPQSSAGVSEKYDDFGEEMEHFFQNLGRCYHEQLEVFEELICHVHIMQQATAKAKTTAEEHSRFASNRHRDTILSEDSGSTLRDVTQSIPVQPLLQDSGVGRLEAADRPHPLEVELPSLPHESIAPSDYSFFVEADNNRTPRVLFMDKNESDLILPVPKRDPSIRTYTSTDMPCNSKELSICGDLEDNRDRDALQLVKGWSRGFEMSDLDHTAPPLLTCTLETLASVLSTFLVVLNTIFTGCQVAINLERAKQGKDADESLEFADSCFTVGFICELGLRWYVYRLNVLLGEERYWNLFDHALTVSSVLEWVSGALDWSFVRSLRVFRAVRVGRVFRVVRFVRELRLMVASVLCSMASFMWACIFLCFVLYFFSVFIALDVTSYLHSYGTDSVDPTILSEYGTILASMLTLFKAITGGSNWSELLEPLQRMSDFYTAFFVLYVAFTVFGVMNILTALFVDSAGRIAEIDRDLVIQEQMSEATATAKALRKVFQAADVSGCNVLNVEALETHFRNREVVAYLRFLELDVLEARGLFQLLDVEGKHVVDIDEFVVGMMRLKGTAKGVDVATLMYENKKVFVRLVAFIKYVEDNFALIRNAMNIEHMDSGKGSKGFQGYMDKEESRHRKRQRASSNSRVEVVPDGSSSYQLLKKLLSNGFAVESACQSERLSTPRSTIKSITSDTSSSERNYQQ